MRLVVICRVKESSTENFKKVLDKFNEIERRAQHFKSVSNGIDSQLKEIHEALNIGSKTLLFESINFED